MPILLVPVVLVGVLLLVVLLIPLSIVQRYRLGTSRRRVRGCLALGNAVGFAISALLVLTTAVVAGIWEPRALAYVAAGLATGAVLGVLGLALSRWEKTPEGLYVTPNRWLVLAIVLVVVARIGYGLLRAWRVATGPGEGSWLAAVGVAGSLAAGAVVIGYYLVYWLGVERRLDAGR